MKTGLHGAKNMELLGPLVDFFLTTSSRVDANICNE
jgi:hypothetical protein